MALRHTQSCEIKHRNPYVACTEEVIYKIPLTCNKVYIGQTGRCINTRLTEHNRHFAAKDSGHLAFHCRDCGCAPTLTGTEIVRKERKKETREVIEAIEIDKWKDKCISCPSVAFSEKARRYLGM